MRGKAFELAVYWWLTVSVVLLGTLRSNDAEGNENVKKAIGLISKTTSARASHCFAHFIPVFARLQRENA